jgi:hypothetical protein
VAGFFFGSTLLGVQHDRVAAPSTSESAPTEALQVLDNPISDERVLYSLA